jgi:ribosomal protein L19E
MVSLKLQKRLAASVMECGLRKVWLDPNEVNEISMANSSECQWRASLRGHGCMMMEAALLAAMLHALWLRFSTFLGLSMTVSDAADQQAARQSEAATQQQFQSTTTAATGACLHWGSERAAHGMDLFHITVATGPRRTRFQCGLSRLHATVQLNHCCCMLCCHVSVCVFCFCSPGQNIRKLIKDGLVIRKPTVIHSRARARRQAEAKAKGRHTGYGEHHAAAAAGSTAAAGGQQQRWGNETATVRLWICMMDEWCCGQRGLLGGGASAAAQQQLGLLKRVQALAQVCGSSLRVCRVMGVWLWAIPSSSNGSMLQQHSRRVASNSSPSHGQDVHGGLSTQRVFVRQRQFHGGAAEQLRHP